MSNDHLRYCYKVGIIFTCSVLALWMLQKPTFNSVPEKVKQPIEGNGVLGWDWLGNTKEERVKNPRIAVILSVSLHKRYLFTLPFTVAAWQNLNVEPIVIVVGDYGTLNKQHQSKTTLSLLSELGATIHYIRNESTSAPTLSQTSRLFAAAMPFSNEYADDDIFITSDADMIPFHLANHIPNLAARQRLYIYNAHCYDTVHVPPARGKQVIPMYSMITLGATVSAWREIMLLNTTKFSGPEIESYLKTEFGSNYFHASDGGNPKLVGSQIWFADQSLCSYKIKEWLNSAANKESTTMTRACARRIDRGDTWPKPDKWQKLDLIEIDDLHVLEWGFKDGQWERFKPMVERVFRDDKFLKLRKRFDKYRSDYIAKDCC